jgi:nitrile hydratase accessory protein
MKTDLDAIEREMPGIPRDAEGPVFQAPWEAQAFAMVVALHEQGAFTWKEWAACLAEVIAEVRHDDGSEYYRHWLTALERIVSRKGILADALLERRRHEWDEAARRTPHGQPIVLK